MPLSPCGPKIVAAFVHDDEVLVNSDARHPSGESVSILLDLAAFHDVGVVHKFHCNQRSVQVLEIVVTGRLEK